MNSDNEMELKGRMLIQAWNSASVELLIEYSSALKHSSLKSRGRITTFDDNRMVLSVGAVEEIEADLEGASFVEVGSKEKIESLGLDPSKYAQSVEISLGNMDRLILKESLGI